MTVITIFRDYRSVLRVSVFLCLLLNTSGCCLSDWDLDFLTDDLFPDVSPLLASTKSFLEDLLKINNYSMGELWLWQRISFLCGMELRQIFYCSIHFKNFF